MNGWVFVIVYVLFVWACLGTMGHGSKNNKIEHLSTLLASAERENKRLKVELGEVEEIALDYAQRVSELETERSRGCHPTGDGLTPFIRGQQLAGEILLAGAVASPSPVRQDTDSASPDGIPRPTLRAVKGDVA